MCFCSLFFLMIRRPPISTLFPCTTLFRSSGSLPSSTTQNRNGARSRSRSEPESAGAPRPPCWLISPAPSSSHGRSEEHTSELQSRQYLVCRLLLEKKTKKHTSELKSRQYI